MLEGIPVINNVTVYSDRSGSFDMTPTGDLKVEIIERKLNEAIRHINALEDKLLSEEEKNQII